MLRTIYLCPYFAFGRGFSRGFRAKQRHRRKDQAHRPERKLAFGSWRSLRSDNDRSRSSLNEGRLQAVFLFRSCCLWRLFSLGIADGLVEGTLRLHQVYLVSRWLIRFLLVPVPLLNLLVVLRSGLILAPSPPGTSAISQIAQWVPFSWRKIFYFRSNLAFLILLSSRRVPALPPLIKLNSLAAALTSLVSTEAAAVSAGGEILTSCLYPRF